MVTTENLAEIEKLIARWEGGEAVWSDPPLCSLLLGEVARLRVLLRDVYPFLVGTPMQEEIRAELGAPCGCDDPPRTVRSPRRQRLCA